MKKITTVILLMFSFFASPMVEAETKMNARITYYWPGNGGQVGYQTATGKRAICGKTAAVDPRLIPYFSSIFIPKMGKTVIALDTGSAVKSKKASGGKAPVIDIFVSSRAEAMRMIKKYPMYMEVIVKN